MARLKVTGTALKDWNEADAVIKRVGQLQLQRENIEAELTEQVTSLKEKAQAECLDIDEEIEALAYSLSSFVTPRRQEFAPARCRVCTFGVVGFRKSTKLVFDDEVDEDVVIERLKARGLKSCIKVKESLDKKAIGKLDDAELPKLGARRLVEDKFYVEPDREKVTAEAV